MTDEWSRIMSEKKREQEADLLFQMKIDHTTSEDDDPGQKTD
mgnify:CR=1 FL=1